jgi:serine/threonine protein kinase
MYFSLEGPFDQPPQFPAIGQLYLSMELVDGENLASLLARIGRLPTAKANDLASGMCAGLTAAHRKGLLHRDLKPANGLNLASIGRPSTYVLRLRSAVAQWR